MITYNKELIEKIQFSEYKKYKNNYTYTFWNWFTGTFKLKSELDLTKYKNIELDLIIKIFSDNRKTPEIIWYQKTLIK